MLTSLKFVQGAVAKKDFETALTHFRIEDGLIKGYNGKIGLCSPIDLNLTASPKAVPFVKAIQTCKDTVSLHMTPTERLAIKSGSFKAFVECTTKPYPDIQPEGDFVPLNGEFLPAIKKLYPFIGQDASRPWSRGILFKGQSAYATNNIILVEHWLGSPFPVEANVPAEALQELIRIGEEPTKLQVSDYSMTFHFDEGRWLKSCLLDLQWPDVEKLLNFDYTEIPDRPETLVEELDRLVPFTDELDRVYFIPGKLSTTQNDESGASVEMQGLPGEGCYNIKQLILAARIASKMDFTSHLKPCAFLGHNIRGVIIGMRA